MVSLSTFLVALAALWIAWDTWRKSSSHVISIENVQSGYQGWPDKPQGCHFFLIYLKNLGLPVYDMTASIGFRDSRGLGMCFCSLNTFDIQSDRTVTKNKTITKGLVVKIGWRSTDLDPRQLAMLAFLKNPMAQKAQLLIYSAGYLVKSFRIGGARDRIGMRINVIVFRLFRTCKLGHFAKKQGRWQSRIPMPQRANRLFSLRTFLSAMRAVHADNVVEQGAGEGSR